MGTYDDSAPRSVAPIAATPSGPLRGTVLRLLLPVTVAVAVAGAVAVAVPVVPLAARGQGLGLGLGWMRGQRAAYAVVASTGAGAAAPEHRREEALQRDRKTARRE